MFVADGGGEGIELVEVGGSNRQDSRRCRRECHSDQNSGEEGFLPKSMLCGGDGKEMP